MKGVDVNKYNLQFGHRKNELLLNELKVSELKLNTNKCFLPLIENHKEKKVTTFSNDSNNFSTSDNKVGLGKLFLKNRNLKKNVLTFNKKEADSIFEISIENFKNKIFKKRKSNFNSRDLSIFEDVTEFRNGNDSIKRKPDDLNRINALNPIKPRHPILWFKNNTKKNKIETGRKNLKFKQIITSFEESTETYHIECKVSRKDIISSSKDIIYALDKFKENKENLKKDDNKITAKLIEITNDSFKEKNLTKMKEVGKKLNWIKGNILEENEDYILQIAFNIDDGSRFLVKKFSKEKLFSKEFEIIKNLTPHKNILGFLNSENSTLFFEYPNNSTLQNFIKKFAPLNDKIIKKITLQLLSTINFLQSKGIAHNNINSSNIFIECDGTIKLSNFTNSTKINENDLNILKNFENLFKIDILSVALIIIEMCTGCAKFVVNNDLDEIYNIINRSCTDNSENIPLNILRFLQSYDNIYKDEKTNVNFIINHPFLK